MSLENHSKSPASPLPRASPPGQCRPAALGQPRREAGAVPRIPASAGKGSERGRSFSSASPPWPLLLASPAAGSPRGAEPRHRNLPSGPAAEGSAGRHSQTARQRAIKPSPGQPLTLPPAFSSLWLRRSKGSIKSSSFTGSLKKRGGGRVGGEVRGSAREKSLVMAGNV